MSTTSEPPSIAAPRTKPPTAAKTDPPNGLTTDEALFERERRRFLASLEALDRSIPLPHRRQDRRVRPDASEGTTDAMNEAERAKKKVAPPPVRRRN